MECCFVLPAALHVSVDFVAMLCCLFVLAAYLANGHLLRTVSAKLLLNFTVAVLIGLPVWMLPSTWGFDVVQAAVLLFSATSSILWAAAYVYNKYLVVSCGSHVPWRYAPLYHLVAWGLPILLLLVSAADGALVDMPPGSCLAQPQHSYTQLVVSALTVVLALLLLFILRLTGFTQQQPHLIDALRQQLRQKQLRLGSFVGLLVLLLSPGVAVHLMEIGGAGTDSPCALTRLRGAVELSCALLGYLPLLLFFSQGPVRKHVRWMLAGKGGLKYVPASARDGTSTHRSSDRAALLSGQAGSASEPPLGLQGSFAEPISTPTETETRASASSLQELQLWVGTWNMGNTQPQDDIGVWIPPNGAHPGGGFYDVLVVSAQECSYKQATKDFFAVVRHLVGDEYVFTSRSLHEWLPRHGIRLLVAVRKSLALSGAEVTSAEHGTGLLNVFGNKGAVGVRLQLGPTSICFVGAHLAPHAENQRRRLRGIRQLFAGLLLGTGTPELPAEVHHLMLLGDLNFRLQPPGQLISRRDAKRGVGQKFRSEVVQLIEKQEWRELLSFDQLNAAREDGLLHRFQEGDVDWPPSYRYVDSAKKRRKKKLADPYSESHIPSYTDRILFVSAPAHGSRLSLESYRATEQLRTSDHAPVYAEFTLRVPHGIGLSGSDRAAAATFRLRLLDVFLTELRPSDTAPTAVPTPLVVFMYANQRTRTSRSVAYPSDASCSSAVVANPMLSNSSRLYCLWETADLASASATLKVPGGRDGLREHLLVLLVRDLELLGEEDCLGVATIPLLTLPADDSPTFFRTALLRGTRSCGLIEGRLEVEEVA